MRLTTDFWASAIVRRVFAMGGFAAVTKKGAAEAGAVLIVRRDRFGEGWLYAPAPQTSYDSERPDERLFAEVLHTQDEEEIARRIEREMRFDPDLWVLELEVDAAQFSELISVSTP